MLKGVLNAILCHVVTLDSCELTIPRGTFLKRYHVLRFKKFKERELLWVIAQFGIKGLSFYECRESESLQVVWGEGEILNEKVMISQFSVFKESQIEFSGFVIWKELMQRKILQREQPWSLLTKWLVRMKLQFSQCYMNCIRGKLLRKYVMSLLHR